MGTKKDAATAVQPGPVHLDPIHLDYDFHRFIGLSLEGQRGLKRFYLPYFANSKRVLDLACGEGGFVSLLLEQGIDVVGVDSDPRTCADAQAQNLPVVCEDVLDYLAATPSESVDGIFCAHLVEHMPYPQVMQLIRESSRVLKPGGRLLVATPDCRSLFSHLEMYYLHFGHVSFYHPELLRFLLEHEGLGNIEIGVHPITASHLLPAVQELARRAPANLPGQKVPYQRTIPPQGASLLHKLSYAIKRRLAQWLVLPFVDSLAASTHERLATLEDELLQLGRDIQGINGPFECFATGIKKAENSAESASPPLEPENSAKDTGAPNGSSPTTSK